MTQEKITLALREALLDWFDLKEIEKNSLKAALLEIKRNENGMRLKSLQICCKQSKKLNKS